MPPEPITAKILIVDAGPLITLAAAASLDYQLHANGTVIIPDAVFFEATCDASRLGANVIVEWANANLERIHIAPTHAFAAFTRDYEAGEIEHQPDLGEQAAIEFARHPGCALTRAAISTSSFDPITSSRVLIATTAQSPSFLTIRSGGKSRTKPGSRSLRACSTTS